MKHGLACLLSAIAMLALTASIALASPPDHPIRVGILIADPEHNPGDQALVEALRELGYAAGRNIIFKYKSAEGRPELFAPRATARIARASAGLTRRINILADKALLAAYTDNTHAVRVRHVKAAVADSEFAALAPRAARPAAYVAAALAFGAALGAALHWWYTVPASLAAPYAAQAAVARAPVAGPATRAVRNSSSCGLRRSTIATAPRDHRTGAAAGAAALCRGRVAPRTHRREQVR